MKRILFISILIFCHFNTRGQDNDTTDFKVDANDRSFVTGWISGHNSWDIHGGILHCDFTNLNTKFKVQFNNTFSENIVVTGISLKPAFHINRYFAFDGHLTYQFIVPRQYDFSNSLIFKLGGFHIGMDLGKDIFPKSSIFDFLIGVGFNTGRLKLLRKDLSIEEEYLKYTNPLFAPKIFLEPKLVIKKISLSIKGEYLFDISNSNWNIKDSRLPSLGTSKSSGLLFQGGIGWKI